jgi:hypothetical protein
MTGGPASDMAALVVLAEDCKWEGDQRVILI